MVPDYARYPSLIDRSVLITGGADGIGADMVHQFARQGARVGFVDINAPAAAAVVRSAGTGARHKPRFVEADLCDIAALRRAIDAIMAHSGPVRVLINNAANDDRHDYRDVTPEDWDRYQAVNLRHQFFAIQAVAPAMAGAGGGSIVNLGSISWMIKEPDYPAYATAKAAVEGLTRVMARKLGPDRIRVNCLVPGWVFTRRQLEKWWTPEAEAAFLAQQCLKHRVTPAAFNRMTLFLAADDSEVCTAQSFIVDAGRY